MMDPEMFEVCLRELEIKTAKGLPERFVTSPRREVNPNILYPDPMLRSINAEIIRRENPDWWQRPHSRVHPARQIKVPMVRGPEAEMIAREFFSTVSRDSELLCKRVGILHTWSKQPVIYKRIS